MMDQLTRALRGITEAAKDLPANSKDQIEESGAYACRLSDRGESVFLGIVTAPEGMPINHVAAYCAAEYLHTMSRSQSQVPKLASFLFGNRAKSLTIRIVKVK